MSKPVLKSYYLEEIVPALMKSRGYVNKHQVPTIDKVVINSAVSAVLERSTIDDTASELALLAGQKPIITKARQSVSNFKVRQGMPLGAKVTLRGNQMYEFLYRLIGIALPEIRDFRGVSNKFDGHGNYTLGITDITIFPEINSDTLKRSMGLDITIVTGTDDDQEARELLSLLGFPFRDSSSN